jgi:hypothetical protein
MYLCDDFDYCTELSNLAINHHPLYSDILIDTIVAA